MLSCKACRNACHSTSFHFTALIVWWALLLFGIQEKKMAKEFAKSFYNSKAWKKCRAAYIAYRQRVDGGLCESCHEAPGYIVHHKIELTPDNIDNPDIALGFGNLKYDCHICHQKENVKDEVTGLVQYEFSPDGDIISTPPLNLN